MMADGRTTALGLFHYAHSYAASARELSNLKLAATHPEAPTRFLYGHAIELYLKAFLLLNGMTVKELRFKPYGHDTESLHDKAQEFGLFLTLPDVDAIEFIANQTIDRYIVTGMRKVVPLAMLEQACRSLHERIGPSVYKSEGLNGPPIPY